MPETSQPFQGETPDVTIRRVNGAQPIVTIGSLERHDAGNAPVVMKSFLDIVVPDIIMATIAVGTPFLLMWLAVQLS